MNCLRFIKYFQTSSEALDCAEKSPQPNHLEPAVPNFVTLSFDGYDTAKADVRNTLFQSFFWKNKQELNIVSDDSDIGKCRH